MIEEELPPTLIFILSLRPAADELNQDWESVSDCDDFEEATDFSSCLKLYCTKWMGSKVPACLSDLKTSK